MMSVVNRKAKHQVETEYLEFWDDSESRNLGCPPPIEGLRASLRHSSVMASLLQSCWGLSTLESWEYCIILPLLLFQPGRPRQWVTLEEASLFQLYGVRPRQAGHWIFQSGRKLGKEGRKPPHHQIQAGRGTVGGDTCAFLRSSQIKFSLPSTLRATTAWEGTWARWHSLNASTGARVLFRQRSSYWSLSAFSGKFSEGKGEVEERRVQMSRPQSVAMSYGPPLPMEFELEETCYTVDKTGGQKGSGLLQNMWKSKDSAQEALRASPWSSDWIIQALGLLQLLPGKPRRLNQTHLFTWQPHLQRVAGWKQAWNRCPNPHPWKE